MPSSSVHPSAHQPTHLCTPPASALYPASCPAAATCGTVQQDTDLFGGDLPDGIIADTASPQACCDACKARAGCGAWTLVPWTSTCYLKAASAGFQVTVRTGVLSAVLPAPTPGSPPPPGVVPPPTGAPPGVTPPVAAPPPAVVPPPVGAPPSTPVGGYTFVPLTEDQKRRMYQLTSIFENAQARLGWRQGWRHGCLCAAMRVSLKPAGPSALCHPHAPVLVSLCRRRCSTLMLSGWATTEVRCDRGWGRAPAAAHAALQLLDRHSFPRQTLAGVTFGFCGFTTGTADGLMVRGARPGSKRVVQLAAAAGPPPACSSPAHAAACRASHAHAHFPLAHPPCPHALLTCPPVVEEGSCCTCPR